MAGFCETEYGCLGTLSIDGPLGPIVLNGPAWDIHNLSPLWYGASVRGESEIMPTAAGRRSNPNRLDEHSEDLLLVVRGDVDPAGVPIADPWIGIDQNLVYLWENVLQPIDEGRGTRDAVLVKPDGTDWVATVRTQPLQAVGDEITDPLFAPFTFTLTITSGMFVLAP